MTPEEMLYDIINRVGQTQDQMREILVRMEADLKYHIQRTDLLEDKVEILKAEVQRPFPWKKVTAIVAFGSAVVGFVSKITGLL